MDFSSFDSHQDLELMKIVDWTFASLFVDVFINTDEFAYVHQLTKDHKSPVRRFYLDLKYDNKLFRTVMKLAVRGTVPSGNALNTTLGNSVRSEWYSNFLLHKSGVHRSQAINNHNGDDTAMLLSVGSTSKILEGIQQLFQTKDPDEAMQPVEDDCQRPLHTHGTFKSQKQTNKGRFNRQAKGLGQLVKETHTSRNIGDMLSRYIISDSNQIHFFRQPERVRAMSNLQLAPYKIDEDEHSRAVNYSNFYTAGRNEISSNAYYQPEAIDANYLDRQQNWKVKHMIDQGEMPIQALAHLYTSQVISMASKCYQDCAYTTILQHEAKRSYLGKQEDLQTKLNENTRVLGKTFRPREMSESNLSSKGSTSQSEWTPKNHTKEEIQNARNILRQSRQQKYAAYKEFTSNPQTNPFKGQSLEKLSRELKNQNELLKTTMSKLEALNNPKDFTSSQLGMTFDEKTKLKK